MIRAIKLTLADGKFILTHPDNRLSLLEFCNKFNAQVSTVTLPDTAAEHVKSLADVVEVLNIQETYSSPDVDELTSQEDTPQEVAPAANYANNNQRAETLRSRIRHELLEGHFIQVRDIETWGFGLSKGAISRHLGIVVRDLERIGHRCRKTGNRWHLAN